MKKTLFFILMSFAFISIKCIADEPVLELENRKIIKVPNDFPSIAQAIENAQNGDWIILAPGEYFESEIEINKAITVSSEWKLTKDESKIEQTIIDSEDKILFSIHADGVEISGLKIINGNHTLDVEAKVSIIHNRFKDNLDGMSFESGGGGYVAYNYAENDRDDPLDIDIIKNDEDNGTDILVEHNTFINSNDDGIEIRLFTYPNQNINYTIRENIIIGSKKTGIQLISYDEYTGKVFHIHNNIITGCMVGLGCMDGSGTQEDLTGALKMDELVYLYNNTLVGNKMGATGGKNMVAVNNVVAENELGGFKLFGASSAIVNNLFYQNGGDDFIEINKAAKKSENTFSIDPLLENVSYAPNEKSPCIDAGVAKYVKGIDVLEIPSEYIFGSAPDIGAVEYGAGNKSVSLQNQLIVDAGEDMVLVSPVSQLVLKGKIRDDAGRIFSSAWNLKSGPGEVEILNSREMETKVVFEKQGIYQFSFTCSEGKIFGLDYVTIKYINEGEGKQLFLKEETNNFIEVEDFSYSYGKVDKIDDKSVAGNKYISLNEDKKNTFGSILEFSIGMAETNEYEMWFLAKSQSSNKNILHVNFNNKLVGEIPVSKSKDFQWVKMSGKILANPGQWSLLISNISGKAIIDKIVFTKDSGFIPD
ncbi:MAG: hypothetical protein HN955_11620 [Prolixibacteraceae bacterium]|jgi:hypothetical protein|nr:hypothetical protein [Prolixibacteraceae bacterium]MBT6765667.1 hypothetical protein [Prolixibacteraceae bacterium]MBT6999084.1 hypothetical protein [Prolixibacteraceae bacterium]